MPIAVSLAQGFLFESADEPNGPRNSLALSDAFLIIFNISRLTGGFLCLKVCVVVRILMSKQRENLLFRQEQLKRQINDALDLLQGSLHKNPSQRGWHLTTKVDGKTVTKYVRQELVPQVRALTANHLKVRKLLGRLSQANWRLLQLPPDD